jgi:pimeloyl-ACP methyl ester carboxylesterase
VRVVLVAGWNEAAKYMRTYIDGRRGIDGLSGLGFDCTVFPDRHDGLRERVDRFAEFLDAMHIREPEAFPIATVGYSAGGLVTRGFLRAYPHRANEIAATVQVGAPNGGLMTRYAALTMKLAFLPNHVLADMDVESDFMYWLNDTGGKWVQDWDNPRKKRWVVDGEAWVAPPGHRLLAIGGRMPKYHSQSDGVVMIESASLAERIPTFWIDDNHANHLNLGAVFNPLAFIARGFKMDDRIWPRVVELSAKFLRGEPLA